MNTFGSSLVLKAFPLESIASHVLLADSIPEHECFCAADLLVVDVGKNTEC